MALALGQWIMVVVYTIWCVAMRHWLSNWGWVPLLLAAVAACQRCTQHSRTVKGATEQPGFFFAYGTQTNKWTVVGSLLLLNGCLLLQVYNGKNIKCRQQPYLFSVRNGVRFSNGISRSDHFPFTILRSRNQWAPEKCAFVQCNQRKHTISVYRNDFMFACRLSLSFHRPRPLFIISQAIF